MPDKMDTSQLPARRNHRRHRKRENNRLPHLRNARHTGVRRRLLGQVAHHERPGSETGDHRPLPAGRLPARRHLQPRAGGRHRLPRPGKTGRPSNAAVHPAVERHARTWHEAQAKQGLPYTLKEAALLVENGSYRLLTSSSVRRRKTSASAGSCNATGYPKQPCGPG